VDACPLRLRSANRQRPEESNEDDYHITGTLYSLTKPLAKPGKPGPEWNTMVITLDGPRTIVALTTSRSPTIPKASRSRPQI